MSTAELNTKAILPAIRRKALNDLLVVQASGGVLSRAHVREAAHRAEVSESTMWRWVRDGEVPQTREHDAYEVGHDELVVLQMTRGNVSAAARKIVATCPDPPSARTIRRHLAHAVPRVERAGMRTGHQGVYDNQLYMRFEADHRNEIWEADHKELSLHVRLGNELIKPWATIMIDSKSRTVMGTHLSPAAPTADSTMMCLIDAIGNDGNGSCGGIPEAIRWDNDTTFTADRITEFLAALGCDARPTDAYKPNQKGKIERFNRTVEMLFSSMHSGWEHGPVELNGTLMDRTDVLLSWTELKAAWWAFIDWYNREHQHRSLGGQSPLSVWEADPHPITEISRSELLKIIPSQERVVQKDGVHLNGEVYFHGCLPVGAAVQVRVLPDDDSRIEIYRDDEWLCTAQPHDQIPEAEVDRFFRERGRTSAHVNRHLRTMGGSGDVLVSKPRDPEPDLVTESDIRDAHAELLALRRQRTAAKREAC